MLAALSASAALTARWLARRFVVVDVGGPSMAPTYSGGERVLVQRTPPAAIERGHVVVLELPTFPSDAAGGPRDPGEVPTWRRPPHGRRVTDRRWMIKRVAALAGEETSPEFAEAAGVSSGCPVPDGHVLVAGDNTEASYDSRTFGYVPMERVLGIALRTMSATPPPASADR